MWYKCTARSSGIDRYGAYIVILIPDRIVVSIMKSIQINGKFTALDFHTGAVLEYHVDYDVVKKDGGKFFVPRSIEPIMYMERIGETCRSYFFNGNEWKDTESTFVDTDDLPVEVLVTIIGKFFPYTTSRGNRVFLRTIKQFRAQTSFVCGNFFEPAAVAFVAPVENAPFMVHA